MRSTPRALLPLLLLSLFALPLAAQDIREINHSPRSGFWWGLGLGMANGELTCPSGCGSLDKESFTLGDIHLGFTPSPKLTLGFQFTGGKKSDAFLQNSSVDETIGDANFSAYLYPSENGNLFLQGGVAGVVWQAKQGSNSDNLVTGGLTLGIGYDLRFGRNASITPTVRGVWGAKGQVKDQDGNDVPGGADFKLSFIHAGVSILWH